MFIFNFIVNKGGKEEESNRVLEHRAYKSESFPRLPQRNGSYVYARCSDPNEFWVALVEKAVAKLHGSYEAIEGGMPIEAMVDLTGGLAERYELKNDKMHKTLYRYHNRNFACLTERN